MIKRNSGIDVYRIVLTFFICILHVLGQGGILETTTHWTNSVYWFLETSAYCAVDGYGLISGYMSNSTKSNYKRIAKLWLEVFFYSLVVTLILRFFEFGKQLTFFEIIYFSFPILSNKFWYMTCYFPVFFFMPYINKFINKLSNKEARNVLLLIIVLFSFGGIINDVHLNEGYSFLWLLILFVIGSIMKKIHIFENTKSSTLIGIYILCIVLSWITKITPISLELINYISPTILLSAMVLLVVFSRIKTNSKFISFISSTTTGIYLFQNNEIIWEYIFLNRFVFISSMPIVKGMFMVLVCALLVFFIGFVADCIRKLLFRIWSIDYFVDELTPLIEERIGKMADKTIKVSDDN